MWRGARSHFFTSVKGGSSLEAHGTLKALNAASQRSRARCRAQASHPLTSARFHPSANLDPLSSIRFANEGLHQRSPHRHEIVAQRRRHRRPSPRFINPQRRILCNTARDVSCASPRIVTGWWKRVDESGLTKAGWWKQVDKVVESGYIYIYIYTRF